MPDESDAKQILTGKQVVTSY